MPQEVRDGVDVPAVELVVQRAREHDADEVGGEDGRDDELGRQLLETCDGKKVGQCKINVWRICRGTDLSGYIPTQSHNSSPTNHARINSHNKR